MPSLTHFCFLVLRLQQTCYGHNFLHKIWKGEVADKRLKLQNPTLGAVGESRPDNDKVKTHPRVPKRKCELLLTDLVTAHCQQVSIWTEQAIR